jgi:hypothetical protein
MVAATSTSTLGLAIWTVGLAACGWLAKRISLFLRYRQLPRREQIGKALEDGFHDALIEAIAISVLALIAWGAFVPVVVYRDHVELRSKVAALTRQRDFLSSDLDARKNNLFVKDPAFGNINHLLQDFQMYRGARKDGPCVIYVTATPDSMAIASTVAQFSNSVSGCFTFGPSIPRDNPDLDEMTNDGMVPGVILVHLRRDDKPGITLEENLGNQIQTRLSYEPPKIPKNHLYAGTPEGASFVWLQFGAGVKWNGEGSDKER